MTALTVKACPFCGSDKQKIDGASDCWYIHCEHCEAEGPVKSTREAAIEAWDAALRKHEPSLGETIIERLSDFERQLAALRSYLHGKALHGIGAIGLRVTELEKFPRVEEVPDEPYIPYRDEVWDGTGQQHPRMTAKSNGFKWYCVQSTPMSHVYVTESGQILRDSGGYGYFYEDIGERPQPTPEQASPTVFVIPPSNPRKCPCCGSKRYTEAATQNTLICVKCGKSNHHTKWLCPDQEPTPQPSAETLLAWEENTDHNGNTVVDSYSVLSDDGLHFRWQYRQELRNDAIVWIPHHSGELQPYDENNQYATKEEAKDAAESFEAKIVREYAKEQPSETEADDDHLEPVASPSRGWRPTTETPTEGETIWLESNIGYFQYHAPVWDQYCQFKPEHTRWIPLHEVLAAIGAAEVPELERRMDERFKGWTAERDDDGEWDIRDNCTVRIASSFNSYAAAMRAALEAK